MMDEKQILELAQAFKDFILERDETAERHHREMMAATIWSGLLVAYVGRTDIDNIKYVSECLSWCIRAAKLAKDAEG